MQAIPNARGLQLLINALMQFANAMRRYVYAAVNALLHRLRLIATILWQQDRNEQQMEVSADAPAELVSIVILAFVAGDPKSLRTLVINKI